MLSEGKLEELEKVARELSRFRLRRGIDHWRLYHDDIRIDGPWKDDELQLADDALHLAQAKAAEAELAALRAQAPAPVEEAMRREHTLAQIPALIMANIEEVPDWQCSAPLVTAHCHASVLHEDMPDALISPAPVSAEVVEAARAVVERWDTPLWKDVEPTAHVINRLREALAAVSPDPTEGGTDE